MERTSSKFRDAVYDIVVVGGGVYGLSVARDAALRGLSVALVEQGDFGAATSSNSHKIMHGGLRYLQHGNLKRMRESIRERSALMRIAPHLVSPMPFLIPTYRGGGKGKWIMKAALALNDMVGFDRNQTLPFDKHIPNGRIISSEECLRFCPGLDHRGLTGGAVYYDAQLYNADRFILSLCHSAYLAGAQLANYMRAEGLVRESNRVVGLEVIDELSGENMVIRSNMVVNCAGPWCATFMGGVEKYADLTGLRWIKALVLVTRSLTQEMAVGVPSRYQVIDRDALVNKGHRYFFITPWRGRSLVGTYQKVHRGLPDAFRVDPEEVGAFVKEIQASLPGGNLRKEDITHVYGGLLPMAKTVKDHEDPRDGQFQKSYILRDHEEHDGVRGLLSVVGVKFTTARDVAEKTVDLILKKLKRPKVESQTARIPVYGGEVEPFTEFLDQEMRMAPREIDGRVMGHLLKNYGAKYQDVLNLCREDPSLLERISAESSVIKAEVIHGVRNEMAWHLSDVVMRRTELGTAGIPGQGAIQECATLMARERSWCTDEMEGEIEAVFDLFKRAHGYGENNKDLACVS